uniref:SPOC domain-containing protein n=1 Tax=Heliothis virescens TaxID=7102 RepID=A0A2A4K0K0_HELVI
MSTVLVIIFAIITQVTSQCGLEDSVELVNRMYNGVEYKNGEYFVDNVTNVERGCVCLKETCARKCCPPGTAYRMVDKMCVNISDPFEPPTWKGHHVVKGFNATKKLHFLFGKVICSNKTEVRIPAAEATDIYRLMTVRIMLD